MLLLSTAASYIGITTTGTPSLDIHVSYADLVAGAVSPDTLFFQDISAGSNSIVGGPVSGKRNIENLSVYNKDTEDAPVTLYAYDGATTCNLISARIPPSCVLLLNEGGVWALMNSNGRPVDNSSTSWVTRNLPFMKVGTASDAIGYWYGTWKDAGVPPPFTPSTTVAGGQNMASVGALRLSEYSGYSNYRLKAITMCSSVAHLHKFVDVLWSNTGLSVTTLTAQTVNSGVLPERYTVGDSDGRGCVIGLMFTAASTLAAVNALSSVSYTNSAGVAGRTATLSTAMIGSQAPATPVIGTVLWYNLAAGDTGVRSIQSFTIGGTSWLTGSISLFICRPLAVVPGVIANIPVRVEFPGEGIPLGVNASILHFILASAATATFFNGELVIGMN